MSYFSADGNYEVRYKSNVLIYPNGEVLWVPPAIYQVNTCVDINNIVANTTYPVACYRELCLCVYMKVPGVCYYLMLIYLFLSN